MNLEEFKSDYDWRCAFNEARGSGYTWDDDAPKPPGDPKFPRASNGYTGSRASFDIGDVAEIIATSDGENDTRDWVGAFRLNDWRFLMVRAGCDYTGWDCQASGDSEVADSLENLIRWSMNDEERVRLGFVLGTAWCSV